MAGCMRKIVGDKFLNTKIKRVELSELDIEGPIERDEVLKGPMGTERYFTELGRASGKVPEDISAFRSFRNALSLDMLTSLLHSLQSTNQDLRVIILRANGKVFSSGHDLKELTAKQGREYHAKVFSTCTEVMSLIPKLAVPVIAQVSGLATAAGCQLVASCDVVVAAESAQFATPGVNVGLFCSTPAVAVARSVPSKVAMEMLLTGHPISAHDAVRHGLVSKVVPDEDLDNQTLAIAEKICSTSKSVVALGKACYYAQITLDPDSAYRLAEKTMVDNLQLPDGQEGISAFVEKRTPVWSR